MGKFERKIVLILVATAVVPLVVSALMLQGILRESFEVGVNARVRAQLDAGVAARRELVQEYKRRFDADAAAIAGSQALAKALRSGDDASLRRLLDAELAGSPNLVRLALEEETGPARVAVGRASSFPAKKYRTREIRIPIPDPGRSSAVRFVRATYAVPWALFHDFEEAGQFARTFGSLARSRGNLERWYRLVFVGILAAVLLGVTLTGVVVARRVTRRLGRLALAIESVAQGDLSIKVPVVAGDEIGDLTRAFNAMVSDLRGSRRRIAYLERLSAWQEIARRLAHEIKNPLTPIQLAVQEVHRQYQGEDARYRKLLDDTLQIVEEEIGTLRRLTGEFSSFARLPEVRPVSEDLWEFLRDCRHGLAIDEDVRVQWNVPDGECLVPLDRMLMKRVLDNLVRNGVEAARGAGVAAPRVTISGEVEPDGRRVRICVADNGPGIPVADRDRIFEPYFTTKPEGTGLGLAIVNKIVLDHGGEITVVQADTSRGGGAELVMALPLRSGSRW
ncbi:MAG: HAMP domain-containing protein [Deltaproteobacteria bacterium]|nr:HAMP domain-containing protein [Deltaproteobacteria bacterium]